MPYPQLNRSKLIMKPLAQRQNRKSIERNFVSINEMPPEFNASDNAIISECAERIITARKKSSPVILAFGAHTIKNGLAPILIKLIETGYLTHLATNGAGIIHDWEFAFQGESSEDVKENMSKGEFGNWEETGFFINLALNVGSYEGKGYGESIGAFIYNESLNIPSKEELAEEVEKYLRKEPARASAAAELLGVIQQFNLKPGQMQIAHRWKKFSIQAQAYQLGIPFTGHAMIGQDIIYNHPMNNGSLLGKAALRDFLSFAESVNHIENGVYLSVGSAVMSPMIFEKSMSMAQNLALQRGNQIKHHYILVVDLAKSNWDWDKGEPPEDNPAYYQRFNKTFSRMGGRLQTLSADNRAFLLALYCKLQGKT